MTKLVFPVVPMGKPRMVRSDKWKKRDCVERYWAFKDDLKKVVGRFQIPESGYHLKFFLPMPESWSKRKKAQMAGKPHQQVPDKDNLEKAFLDALCEKDCHIWNGEVSKFWDYEGRIEIEFKDFYEVLQELEEILKEINEPIELLEKEDA